MDERKKKIITFIGTLFIAVMFVGSYAAFNNNSGTTTTSTTTIQGGATYFVSGTTNAVVNGYSQLASIALKSNSTAVSSQASNVLAHLQDNGSISNYVAQGNGFQVFTQSVSAYQLQQILNDRLGNSTAVVNATSSVTLPSIIPLTYRNQIVDVRLISTNFTLSISPLRSVGANVTAKITALIYANGDVFNNQITVTST